MKIKTGEFKGIYTNEDGATLPLEYCADTDVKIEKGWIEAKNYQVVETTRSDNTILFQKEILLDEDKLKNGSYLGERVNTYTYVDNYYNCTITEGQIKLVFNNDKSESTFSYSGKFIKAIEQDGILVVITQTKVYYLCRVNRKLQGSTHQVEVTVNGIQLIDISNTVYSNPMDIKVYNDTAKFHNTLPVKFVPSLVVDNTHEYIRVTTVDIVSDDAFGTLYDTIVIVRYYQDAQCSANKELGFAIYPSYGMLHTDNGGWYGWYEIYAKLLAQGIKQGFYNFNSNKLDYNSFFHPIESSVYTLFLSLLTFLVGVTKAKEILTPENTNNCFTTRYSGSTSGEGNWLSQFITPRQNATNAYLDITHIPHNGIDLLNNPYYYSYGSDQYIMVDEKEFISSTYTYVPSSVPTEAITELPADVISKLIPPGKDTSYVYSGYTFISGDVHQSTFRIDWERLTGKQVRQYSAMFDYGPNSTYKTFGEFQSSFWSKPIYMYGIPSNVTSTKPEDNIFFPKGYTSYSIIYTAVINNEIELEIGRKSLIPPTGDTNYLRLTGAYKSISNVITKYRVYVGFDNKHLTDCRLLAEIDFLYGKPATTVVEENVEFKDYSYQDLTGVYYLQTVNRPEGAKYLDLTIDDYYNINGVPVILNRGLFYYGALGNGKYMPVFYDCNFVPGIQGKMFVYINGTLGIVAVDRIVMLNIVAQEGVLLFSKKDELGFVVRDKYDIAETPDGVILHTRSGIYATNGQQLVPLSEPINDIVRTNWEDGNIFFDAYEKQLWYIISHVQGQTSGAIYIYDFNYGTWICLAKVVTAKYTSFYTDQLNQKFLVSDNLVSRVSLNDTNCHINYHPTHFNEMGVKKKIVGIKFDLDGSLSWDGKTIISKGREIKKLGVLVNDIIPTDFIELKFDLKAKTKLYGFELTLDMEKDSDEYPVQTR